MSAKPPPAELIALFDADPGKYKDAPEPDGYNPTQRLIRKLSEAPLIPNPIDQPQLPKPLSAQDLHDALTDAEKAAIDTVWFRAMEEAIGGNARETIKRLVNIALKKGWIGEQKAMAMVAEVDATISDPDWKPMVNGLNDLRANWPDEEPGIHFSYVEGVLGR